jgi:hypothetical protein
MSSYNLKITLTNAVISKATLISLSVIAALSAILLVFSERFPTSGNDVNVALLMAVLVTHA